MALGLKLEIVSIYNIEKVLQDDYSDEYDDDPYYKEEEGEEGDYPSLRMAKPGPVENFGPGEGYYLSVKCKKAILFGRKRRLPKNLVWVRDLQNFVEQVGVILCDV